MIDLYFVCTSKFAQIIVDSGIFVRDLLCVKQFSQKGLDFQLKVKAIKWQGQGFGLQGQCHFLALRPRPNIPISKKQVILTNFIDLIPESAISNRRSLILTRRQTAQ